MDTTQADLNFTAYNKTYRQGMEEQHWGGVALMHNGEIVGIYNDRGDAYSIGCDKYGLGNFSLQNIGEQPAKLGVLTAALQ